MNPSRRAELAGLSDLCSLRRSNIDAMNVTRFLQQFGWERDWHYISSLLDELHTRGHLEVQGYNSDGMTIYKTRSENG